MGVFEDEYASLNKSLRSQNRQISAIQKAESAFEQTGDIGALIEFWESVWNSGGLLFNGSKWTFRLPDLYIKVKQYDDALRILQKIKNPVYQDKVMRYTERITATKEKAARRKTK